MNAFLKIKLPLVFWLFFAFPLFSTQLAFYPLEIINEELPHIEEAVESLLDYSITWEEEQQAKRHLEKSHALYWLSWIPLLEVEYAYQTKKEIEEAEKRQSAITFHFKQPIPLGWEWYYELKGQKRKQTEVKERQKNIIRQIHFEMENRYLKLFQMEEEYDYLVKQNLFWEQIYRIAEKRKEFKQINEIDYQSILINRQENRIQEKSSLKNLQYEFKSLLLSIGEEKKECHLPLFNHQKEPFQSYQEKKLKTDWILEQTPHHPERKELLLQKESYEDQLAVGAFTFLPRLEYQLEWNLTNYGGYYLINRPQSGFRLSFQLPGIQFDTQWSEKKLPYERSDSAIGKSYFNINQWNQIATLVQAQEAIKNNKQKIHLFQKRVIPDLLDHIAKIETLKEQIQNGILRYKNKEKEQEIHRILYEKGEMDLYRLADGEKECFTLLSQIGQLRFFYLKTLFDLATKCGCEIQDLFEENV